MRPSGRTYNELRQVKFTRHFTTHAEGSVLVESGNTQVICTASISENVPYFLRGKNQGWITAEYGMLPRSTHSRMGREAAKGKQSGRTMEIQRLIGRSLRAIVNLSMLGERQITLDCDVIQADGGTRTAAISGAFVALSDAINSLLQKEVITSNPIIGQLASVSVGIYKGQAVLDLDYAEDSQADTDMNVVMNQLGQIIEIQATAEGKTFTREEMNNMLDLAEKGIHEIMQIQTRVLSN